MCVRARVCRFERGLSQRVSLEVSSDACTGGGSQDMFLYRFLFLFGYILDLYFDLFLAQHFFYGRMYLVNRLETTCRKSLIPFHAVWGLCSYNFARMFSDGFVPILAFF